MPGNQKKKSSPMESLSVEGATLKPSPLVALLIILKLSHNQPWKRAIQQNKQTDISYCTAGHLLHNQSKLSKSSRSSMSNTLSLPWLRSAGCNL